MGIPRWARAALLVAALVGEARAAATPHAHLIYLREVGAERCPEEAALRGAVTARLGYDPFSPEAQITLTVVIRRATKGLAASIEVADLLGDPTGLRQLSSPNADCEELAPAVALAVSLAIDPESWGRTNPLAPAPPQPSPAPVTPPPVTPPPSQPRLDTTPAQPPKGERLRLRFGFSGHAALDVSPTLATGGLALRFGVRQARWSASVEARGDFPVTWKFDGGEVSATRLMASLVPCVHFQFAAAPSLDLAGCAVLSTGALVLQGTVLVKGPTETDALWSAGGRAALEVAVARGLSLFIHLDLLWILNPALRVSETAPTLYSGSPALADLGAGLIVYFQ